MKMIVCIGLLALLIPMGVIRSRRGVSENRVDGQLDTDTEVPVDKVAAAARKKGSSKLASRDMKAVQFPVTAAGGIELTTKSGLKDVNSHASAPLGEFSEKEIKMLQSVKASASAFGDMATSASLDKTKAESDQDKTKAESALVDTAGASFLLDKAQADLDKAVAEFDNAKAVMDKVEAKAEVVANAMAEAGAKAVDNIIPPTNGPGNPASDSPKAVDNFIPLTNGPDNPASDNPEAVDNFIPPTNVSNRSLPNFIVPEQNASSALEKGTFEEDVECFCISNYEYVDFDGEGKYASLHDCSYGRNRCNEQCERSRDTVSFEGTTQTISYCGDDDGYESYNPECRCLDGAQTFQHSNAKTARKKGHSSNTLSQFINALEHKFVGYGSNAENLAACYRECPRKCQYKRKLTGGCAMPIHA